MSTVTIICFRLVGFTMICRRLHEKSYACLCAGGRVQGPVRVNGPDCICLLVCGVCVVDHEKRFLLILQSSMYREVWNKNEISSDQESNTRKRSFFGDRESDSTKLFWVEAEKGQSVVWKKRRRRNLLVRSVLLSLRSGDSGPLSVIKLLLLLCNKIR